MRCCLAAGLRAVLAVSWALGLAGAATAQPVDGLIVKFKNSPAHERVSALGASAANAESTRIQRTLSAVGVGDAKRRPLGRAAHLVQIGRPLAAAQAQRLADQLRAQPEVEWVVPNERERRLQVVTPNDPSFGGTAGQWWLQRLGGSSANAIENRLRGVPDIQTAWSYDTGSPAVASALIAVLDSGITTHAELSGRVLQGRDFVSETEYANDGDGRDSDPSDPGDWVDLVDLGDPLFRGCTLQDSSWHGTIISGMVAAATDNGAGVAALNWDGQVLPVRVAGKCGATVADIVDGMRWAAGLAVAGSPINNDPARIINLSFGGSAACNEAYQDAIDELAATRGAVVVAAAGNENGAPTRPANCAGVIGVGALNRDGFKASYSNFGPQVVVSTVGGDPVWIGAWGQWLGDDGLLTLVNLGAREAGPEGYGNVSGTSFSAPVVSGVVGLMLSVNPNLTAAQVIQGLRLSARPHVTSNLIGICSDARPGRCICTATTCGAGMLDAYEALVYAGNPTGYVAPNWPLVVIDSPEVVAAVALGADLPPNPPAGPIQNGGDSGGGALGWAWLSGLALAVVVLARRSGPRRAGRKRLA